MSKRDRERQIRLREVRASVEDLRVNASSKFGEMYPQAERLEASISFERNGRPIFSPRRPLVWLPVDPAYFGIECPHGIDCDSGGFDISEEVNRVLAAGKADPTQSYRLVCKGRRDKGSLTCGVELIFQLYATYRTRNRV